MKLFLAVFMFMSVSHAKVEKVVGRAVFAGGCFWCMESPFEKLPGVISVTSGYSGGKEVSPTYKQVASGSTGHVEAVLIEFDPKKISLRKLVDVYWRQVDPTDKGGQFVDRGAQYRPVLYYYDSAQKKIMDESLKALKAMKKYKKPITIEISPYVSFYPAEDYHQDYYKKSTLKYKYYRYRSGRDQYLDKIWKK